LSTAPSAVGPRTTAGTERPRLRRGWLVLAVVPILVASIWMAIGHPGPDSVVLPRGHGYATTTLIIVLALVAAAVCLVGAAVPVLGLIGLSGVFGAVAVAWPLAKHNQYAGPVLMDFAFQHGLHLNDFLAVVPASAALICLLEAVRQVRERRLPTSFTAPGPAERDERD
jgi:hypothetical protein